MLFPLSKSFCSTHVFQHGGEHQERPRYRVWSIDKENVQDKVKDLHKLIHDKRPYDHHVDLANKYSEPRRQRDLAHSKSHFSTIKSIQERLDETARRERQELRRHIAEYTRGREETDASMRQEFRNQASAFQNAQKEMQARVGEMPALGTPAPPRETAERRRQRSLAQRHMVQKEKRYFEEQKALKDRLMEELENNPPRAKGPSQDQIIEQRKAAMAQSMSKNYREWESNLENMYETHQRRIDQMQKETLSRTMEGLARTKRGQELSALKFSKTVREGKEEIEARKARIAARPKGYAGYEPLLKSSRRIRNEWADGLSDSGTQGFNMRRSASTGSIAAAPGAGATGASMFDATIDPRDAAPDTF